MSIDDQRDLHERLDRAVEAITPPAAPVDGVMRRGKAIRWRRRSAAVAGLAAVVAAGLIVVPSLRHTATDNPATSRYTATVQSPGPNAPPGLIASGTVNGQRWRLTAGKPGAGGAGRGQQFVVASGPAFGPDGDQIPPPPSPRRIPIRSRSPGFPAGRSRRRTERSRPASPTSRSGWVTASCSPCTRRGSTAPAWWRSPSRWALRSSRPPRTHREERSPTRSPSTSRAR